MDHNNQHKNESVEQCCTEVDRIINVRLGQCQQQIETDLEQMEQHYRVGTIFKALITANIIGRLVR